jgi:hypothetical protein
VDARLEPVPVVGALEDALDGRVRGLYVGGSLASRDFRPGVSDIDAVALVDRPPDPSMRRALTAVHQRLTAEPFGADLHCVYVSERHVGDRAYRHWTWAFDELFRRPFSGIARAELLADPVVVRGPAPSTWLTAMSADDLRAAARDELGGYWTRAVRRRAIWQQDVYVDHGLTTVARAAITVREGRLATKAEAIAYLADLGVAPDIVDGVRRRRNGETVPLTAAERDTRARVVREVVRTRIGRLLD